MTQWSSDERSVGIPLECILDGWCVDSIVAVKAHVRAIWGSNGWYSMKAGREMLFNMSKGFKVRP